MKNNSGQIPLKIYIKQLIEANNIAIIGHINPDADAISSALALKRLIKQNLETEDKKYIIDIFFDTDEIDELYKPLIYNQRYNEHSVLEYDLAIAVDCSSKDRLGAYDRIFKNAKDTLNIDHHETNTKFARNNIISIKCSSTCELIYFLFIKALQWHYTHDIYSLIYSGIITDTNNLSQNIGINTLSIVAEIMQKAFTDSVSLEKIRDYFFKNNTPEQLSLLSRALESLSFYADNQIATMKITKQDFIETYTNQEDTLGIVDYAIKLHDVKIGILFIKQDDNSYYVSLRSKDNINVGEVAKQMHGGGHRTIAAFSTSENESLTEIKARLFDLCKQQLNCENNEIKIENLFAETTDNDSDENELDIEEVENDDVEI